MDNFFIAFFSLLPAVTYAYIVYITTPFKSINLLDGMRYLIAGIFSVIILKYFSVIGLNSTAFYTVLSGDLTDVSMGYKHYEYFISVGLMEELSKLLAFFLFSWLMSTYINHEKSHPIAIMFYCGMVGLGFAVAENVHYANESMQPFKILWWRSIAPVITHMTCGFFMGYWISLSRIGPRMYNRSLFDIIIHKRPNLSRVIYTVIGLFSATILHGVYDLHFELNGIRGLSGAYILIILSSLGVLYCFNHIYRIYKIRLEQEKNGEETTKEINKNQGGDTFTSYQKGFEEAYSKYEESTSEKSEESTETQEER
jgi:RsiW-degrading membrane proteinase PrsW (M82 family)